MSRILILGAGASVPAGYPTTYELFPRMSQDAKSAASVQLLDAWNRWRQYLNMLPKELDILRDAKNPELVLSLIDIFCSTAEQEDARRTLDAIESATTTAGAGDTTQLENYTLR